MVDGDNMEEVEKEFEIPYVIYGCDSSEMDLMRMTRGRGTEQG